jgi:GDPmannose 4,6-dehydratase
VTVEPAFWRPDAPVPLTGDPAAIGELLGWKPRRTFPELVLHMLEADLARLGSESVA